MRYLKSLTSVLIILVTSCAVTPIYHQSTTNNLGKLIDSISVTRNLEIPDTSNWVSYKFLNEVTKNELITYSVTFEGKKSIIILTASKYSDSVYVVNYREERN